MRLRTLILAAASVAALASPALAQELTAITGGRVLTGTSVIENGTVVIRDGRVVSVGTGAAPSGARVIDARGKVVAPGFVAVDSGLGGSEVSSVGGSDDLRNGANTISASFDVSYGLDPWSFTLPVARLGGITRANVIRVCGEAGLTVREKRFSLVDVYGADAAFVTGQVISVNGGMLRAG